MLKIKFSLFLLIALLVSCSDKEESIVAEKQHADASPQANLNIEKKEGTDKSSVSVNDIMKPLDGTDPCFEAVELLRDEADVKTYRALGKSTLTGDKEVKTDSHRTYIGIIGSMLAQNKSIPEIRQELLSTCRSLKKKATSSRN